MIDSKTTDKKAIHTNDDLVRFPIRELSLRTGVNSITLRAWERRYGLLSPTRTEKGHRLYSDSDVSRVQMIVAWVNQGVAVSKVRSLLETQITQSYDGIEGISGVVGSSEWADFRDELLFASLNFKETKIASIFDQVFSQYPAHVILTYCFCPVLDQLRQQVAHSASVVFLEAVLKIRISSRILMQNKQANISKMVIANLHQGATGHTDIWPWLLAACYCDDNWKVLVIDNVNVQEQMDSLLKQLQPQVFIGHFNRALGDKYSELMHVLNAQKMPCYLTGASIWLQTQTEDSPCPVDVFLNPLDSIRVITHIQ